MRSQSAESGNFNEISAKNRAAREKAKVLESFVMSTANEFETPLKNQTVQ
jgi:hypothetical protein